MAAGAGRTAGCTLLPALSGAPRPGFNICVASRAERVLPQTPKPGQGCPKGPR